MTDTPEAPIEDEAKTLLELKKWANRRRMAYISLIAAIIITVFILGSTLYSDEIAARISTVEGILMTMAFGFFSLVGAYFGFSTWAGKK